MYHKSLKPYQSNFPVGEHGPDLADATQEQGRGRDRQTPIDTMSVGRDCEC